jgi:hypothetical protein
MNAEEMSWAFGRLAPVQMLFWGHPHTTGLTHSIDYFISSELFHGSSAYRDSWGDGGADQAGLVTGDRADNEEKDSEGAAVGDRGEGAAVGEHSSLDSSAATKYSEQLVLMKSLGFFFERPTASTSSRPTAAMATTAGGGAAVGGGGSAAVGAARSRATVTEIASLRKRFGIRSGSPVLLCPQTLFKFHPRMDRMFVDILARTRYTAPHYIRAIQCMHCLIAYVLCQTIFTLHCSDCCSFVRAREWYVDTFITPCPL